MAKHGLIDICEDDIPETVSMRLECAKCGHVARYRTDTVYIDPEVEKKSKSPEDYVSFGSYFRCRKCKAAGPWVFTPDATLAVTALMVGKLAGLNDDRLVFASPHLFDGTRFRSAAQAEEHLLGILEREPENALVWSRLGNIYFRCDMFPKASKAFTKALELDPDDIESHHSMGEILFEKENYERAAEHLRRVLTLARDHRELAQVSLRDLARNTLQMLAQINVRTDGKVEMLPSDTMDKRGPTDPPLTLRLESYDLADEDDWDRMVDLFMGKKERPAAPAARPVESHRKVGRNEPCPCGSGVKYKKCCGR
jgi:hypothetical protein